MVSVLKLSMLCEIKAITLAFVPCIVPHSRMNDIQCNGGIKATDGLVQRYNFFKIITAPL